MKVVWWLSLGDEGVPWLLVPRARHTPTFVHLLRDKVVQ